MNNNLPKRAVLQKPPVERQARRKRLAAVSPAKSSKLPVVSGKRPPSQERRQPWKGVLAAIATLCGGTTLLFGGAWLSVQLIVDPQSMGWVQSLLPAWSQVPIANKEQPQTLQAIEAKIRQAGLIPSPHLTLEASKNTPPQHSKGKNQQLLLPVMLEQPCSSNKQGASPTTQQSICQQLAELRVYQPVLNPDNPDDRQPYYQLISQLAITGPERSFVLAPLKDTQAVPFGSNGPQPLTSIERLDNAPNPGIWFNLSSERVIGKTKLTYGQIVHYNPETSHLSRMLQWISPGGHTPSWQEVTGGGDPELAIEQTMGIEPQLKVYQLKPVQFFLNPVELVEISLLEPALSIGAYKDALLLAKSGLWSSAWELMASVKQDSSGQDWPDAAQAQLDLIQFHAQITQMQAKANWPNPSQQVLTALIDGNWKKALEVYEAQLNAGDDMTQLLTDETVDLWNRVETAVEVNPSLDEAKAWGALLLSAQYDAGEAIAWFEEQSQNSPEIRSRIYDLLDKQENALAYAENLKGHKSKIVGTASLLTQVNPADWRQPEGSNSLDLESGKVWYQIQVTGFDDSRRWNQTPFSNLKMPKSSRISILWNQLGLHNDSQIQIAVWMPNGEQKTVVATVKGVRLRQGNLLLLASGEGIPLSAVGGSVSQQLAFTASALEWRSPESLTLAQLNQQDPGWVSTLLPSLWQELQAAGQLPSGELPTQEQMLKQIGSWLVQSIDLTGNGVSEAVMTLRSDALVRSQLSQTGTGSPYRTRTLIFDDTGALIYSELTTAAGQSVTGVAAIATGGLPALVVEGNSGYSLQRWSADRKRFEF